MRMLYQKTPIPLFNLLPGDLKEMPRRSHPNLVNHSDLVSGDLRSQKKKRKRSRHRENRAPMQPAGDHGRLHAGYAKHWSREGHAFSSRVSELPERVCPWALPGHCATGDSNLPQLLESCIRKAHAPRWAAPESCRAAAAREPTIPKSSHARDSV